MKIWGKKIKSLKDSNDVVSEIVGTILLLSIVVVVFSTLYSTTLSYPFSPDPPNTSLVGTINNSKDDILARDLSVDFNGDGLWNIGESLIYPFEYDINHTVAEIMAVDGKSNSIVMMGSLNINPECDIGVECSVSNQFPTVGTNVEFSIIVTHYRGDIDVPDIEIEILLPSNGLEYQSNVTTPGTTYDHITGI